MANLEKVSGLVVKSKVQELKEEFDSFKTSVETTQNKIFDILEGMKQARLPVAPTVAQVNPESQPTALDSNNFLPPNYQRIIDKYFDPTDEFEGRLTFPEMNEQGQEAGGITFTIVVPKKFSNMSDAHSKFYKVDLRTVALRPENIIQGIDRWCAKVAQNIRYNKLMETK